MTKEEAIKRFKEEVMPYIRKEYGKDDKTVVEQAWNDWTDALQKEGEITAHQYSTWVHPF